MPYIQLKDRVVFQQQVTEPDSTGGSYMSLNGFSNEFTEDFQQQAGWVNIISTYAEVKPARGQRQVELSQILDQKSYDIKIRYRKDFLALDEIQADELSDDYRIIWKGKELYIHSAIQTHDEKYYEIIAYEKYNIKTN